MFKQGLAKNSLIALFVILTLFLAGKTISEFVSIYDGGNSYPQQTITVSGKGEILAVPDIASISFSVIESGKTVAEAQKLATDKSNKTIAFLKKSGVEEKDIKTTNYSIYPKYEQKYETNCINGYCPSRSIIVGYEVNQSTAVKIRDTAKAGDILTGIGTVGVQNVSGLSLSVDDIDILKRNARDTAIADAKAEAKKLAKALGVRLVRIISYYDNGSNSVYYAKDAVMGMGEAYVSSARPAVVPDISVGQDKITASVSITYEIR